MTSTSVVCVIVKRTAEGGPFPPYANFNIVVERIINANNTAVMVNQIFIIKVVMNTIMKVNLS